MEMVVLVGHKNDKVPKCQVKKYGLSLHRQKSFDAMVTVLFVLLCF